MNSVPDIILQLATQRRTVRRFKAGYPSIEALHQALSTACRAPSGSNMQPWHVLLINDPAVKNKVRAASEAGEKIFYENISEERRRAYHNMGNSWEKPMLENAPLLLAVIADTKAPNYKASVWIFVGYLILALEAAGLGSVTYTPSDSKRVESALNIPEGFRLETILPVGFPDDPKMKGLRKPLEEVVCWNHWAKAMEW